MKLINLLLCVLFLIGGVFAGSINIPEKDVADFNVFSDSLPKAELYEFEDMDLKLDSNYELNLMDYLSYNSGIRDQAACGNCWVWSGMLSTEFALNVEAGINDRLSIQYFDSNIREDGYEPCEGGNEGIFSSFVNWMGNLISWDNEGGDYTDKNYFRDRYDKSSSEISDDVYYPIEMEVKKISSNSVDLEETVKSYLHKGKVIGFSWCLAQNSQWDTFRNFWINNNSDVVIDMDSISGNNTWNKGGCHAVNIVGYNLPERYWIVANSWGNSNGKRPQGTFKMSMDMNYDAKINNDSTWNKYRFRVFDYVFGNSDGLRVEPEVDSKIGIEKVVMDKTTVNPGEVITTSTKVSNDYEYMNLQNVRVSYYIPKLGMKRSVGPFDIEMFEDVMKRVYLDIPKSASAGTYDVRIVLQTEDTKEVRYEEIRVE